MPRNKIDFAAFKAAMAAESESKRRMDKLMADMRRAHDDGICHLLDNMVATLSTERREIMDAYPDTDEYAQGLVKGLGKAIAMCIDYRRSHSHDPRPPE